MNAVKKSGEIRRSLCILVAGGCLLCGLSGCQVARTSFQMDSDSQVPIVGLQLSPRERDISGIRRDYAADDETPVVDLNRGETIPRRSPWSKLLGQFGKPKRIPLPRTDLQSIDNLSAVAGLQQHESDNF